MRGFEETSDNCEYLMRAMETEEIRQSQWLGSKRMDQKAWCVIVGVLGLQFVELEGEVYTIFLRHGFCGTSGFDFRA